MTRNNRRAYARSLCLSMICLLATACGKGEVEKEKGQDAQKLTPSKLSGYWLGTKTGTVSSSEVAMQGMPSVPPVDVPQVDVPLPADAVLSLIFYFEGERIVISGLSAVPCDLTFELSGEQIRKKSGGCDSAMDEIQVKLLNDSEMDLTFPKLASGAVFHFKKIDQAQYESAISQSQRVQAPVPTPEPMPALTPAPLPLPVKTPRNEVPVQNPVTQDPINVVEICADNGRVERFALDCGLVSQIQKSEEKLVEEMDRLSAISRSALKREAYRFAQEKREIPYDSERQRFSEYIADNGGKFFAIYSEAYDLAKGDRAIPYDSERHRFAVQVASGATPALYVSVYRAVYRMTQNLREIPYDSERNRFADEVASKPTGLAYCAIYSAVYKFAKESRGMNYDSERSRFAIQIVTLKSPIDYFLEYREAYLYAKDVRGIPYDSERHSYAVKEAEGQF